MLKIIQEIIKGLNPDEAAVKVHSEYEINPNEDLNKLPQEEVNRKKLIMDEMFEKNRLRPTDPGYKYDKQVDFPAVGKLKSGWDDDDEGAAEDDGESEDKIETVEHEEEDDFW
ncbi:unnamed protein product [Allacma fusca]|uniref:Centrosomal protein of 19 kDa n=1 Tax=Allacma fusca TaxID=39272 RepID=A0A8J2P1G9_9HEXA|nr:unnamed protein product [Allacma fusca]